jgi:general secretion pathway protein B
MAMIPPSSPPLPKPAAVRAPPAAPVKASAPAPAPAPAEEKLPSLRELPEAIQRGVPPVTFGGYMYSKDPADRLLLIDKTLRHEGEEVAPGLVLEKLLPKAAVMNYKGNRYRVPY